jgi:hypothetical protein
MILFCKNTMKKTYFSKSYSISQKNTDYVTTIVTLNIQKKKIDFMSLFVGIYLTYY